MCRVWVGVGPVVCLESRWQFTNAEVDEVFGSGRSAAEDPKSLARCADTARQLAHSDLIYILLPHASRSMRAPLLPMGQKLERLIETTGVNSPK